MTEKVKSAVYLLSSTNTWEAHDCLSSLSSYSKISFHRNIQKKIKAIDKARYMTYGKKHRKQQKKRKVMYHYSYEMADKMSKERKRKDSLKRKSVSSSDSLGAESYGKLFKTRQMNIKGNVRSKNRITKDLLNMKRLQLIQRSKTDIMVRKQKCDSIKEIRRYKNEEMKKIDADVKSMKHDMISYMLKEIEEHKKRMIMEINEEIFEEKNRRLQIIESELNLKVSNNKSIQTDKYPVTLNEKFDEILKELVEIRNSSTCSENILSKETSQFSTNILPNSVRAPSSIDNTLKRLHKHSAEKKTKSSHITVEKCRENPPKITKSKFENVDFNAKNSKRFLPEKNHENSSSDSNFSYNGKSQTNSPTNSLLNHRKSTQVDSPEDDRMFSPVRRADKSSYKNLPSMAMETENYSSTEKLDYMEDRPYVKNPSHTSQKNVFIPSKNVYLSQGNISCENPSNQTSTVTVVTESLHNYVKSLLHPSHPENSLESNLSKPTINLPSSIQRNRYTIKPPLLSSADSSFYMRNMLSSNENSYSDNHNIPMLKTKPFKSLKSFPSSTLEKTLLYNHLNSSDIMLKGKKKYSTLMNSSYDIYAHNKKLISSQKNSRLYGNIDDMTMLQVRKKREISRRVLEKYGPLPNPDEICEKVQSDPSFLSLPLQEKNGILLCIKRSVAEPSTFAKDLLEELFSREALSISSCKGSSIKTALDADKLEFIRRIVFFALPSDDEDAMWDMIQECIDTKCRGILRNMKKKLTKSFEC